MVRIARVVPEISSWKERQTDTQTNILITILRNRSRGRSNHTAAIYRHTTSSCTESKVTNDDAQKWYNESKHAWLSIIISNVEMQQEIYDSLQLTYVVGLIRTKCDCFIKTPLSGVIWFPVVLIWTLTSNKLDTFKVEYWKAIISPVRLCVRLNSHVDGELTLN